MIIKYCCYYCTGLEGCPHNQCYNALGAMHDKSYMQTCRVVNDACAEGFIQPGGRMKPVAECNKDCWEKKERAR